VKSLLLILCGAKRRRRAIEYFAIFTIRSVDAAVDGAS